MNTRHTKMKDISFSLIMIVSLSLSLFGVGAKGNIQQGLDSEDVFASIPEGLDEGEYIVNVSASNFSSCAVRNDGAVECWGSNSRGQLGDGTTINRNLPVEVIGLDDKVIRVDAGTGHTCALLENGGVQCWGNNSSGQLGIGSTENSLEPVGVIGLPGDVDMIGAGYKHTCALLTNGDVYCWGRNLDGQLGDGTTVDSTSPRKVVGISGNVVNLIVGADHNCILFDDGNMQCWGANYDGQLGDGTNISRSSPVNVVSLGDEVKFASASYFHTCAVLKNGSAQCWGYNVSGELGDGTTVSSKTPVYVISLPSSVEKIATGYEHTCALLDEGEVYCWGYNASGELGGTYGYSSYTPKKVVGLDANTVEIATSGSHNCVLTSAGGVKCWGNNEVGQLGDGVDVLKLTPTKVIDLKSEVSFVSTGSSHTCVLMTTGGVKCWGSGGQLGNGSTVSHFSPVDVWGLSSGVKAIAAGGSHTCALMETGDVKCWGINYYGQLGNNSLEDSYTPVDVVNLGGEVVEIAAGLRHTCALLKTGEVQCWGYLDSCFDSSCVSPVYVDGFDGNVTAIAIGTRHICGILESGEIQCWGDDNYGQLGDSDTPNFDNDPVYVVGLTDKSIDITANYNHSCTVLENGNAYCWGDNKYGQLGDGTVIQRISPVNVVGLNGQATQITTGDRSSCALLSSGGVKCWGENGDGELGNGTVEDSYIPVTNLINNAVQIDMGSGHACAVLTAGEVYCWGYNSTGQVGDGTAYYRPSPEYVVGMIPVITYNGSAEITSNQPIVAIGRPHMGAEIMGYNGINSGANTLYLPMLFNNIWNYTSTFTVENTTSSTATYTLTFKDGGDGSTSCVMSGETLPGHGVRTYDVTNLGACDSGYLPDLWAGGAKIESDQPLVAIATPKVDGVDPVTYNAFTGGADTVYLPMLFRNVWGYTSAFYVQNLDSTQNASISIDFYDGLGHFTCRYEDSSPIGPAVTRGYWVPSMSCNDGNSFPAEGWAGSAVIETGGSGSQEIVAIGRPHMGTEVAAYNGFTEGGTSNYLPMLFRNMWGYTSAVYIQNVSGGTITEPIEIVFYDAEGNYTCTYRDNEDLADKATRGYWIPSVNCNAGGSFPGDGWVGSATIHTSGEAIAVGRPHLSDGEVVAYGAFTGGATEAYVPMLFRKYNGNEAALYIQNLGDSDATVTITYYDEESGYYCAMAQEISPLSTGGVWLAGLDDSVCAP